MCIHDGPEGSDKLAPWDKSHGVLATEQPRSRNRDRKSTAAEQARAAKTDPRSEHTAAENGKTRGIEAGQNRARGQERATRTKGA